MPHCAIDMISLFSTTASTLLNKRSSRSHSILLLKIVRHLPPRILTGHIHIVDLAGSEDNRRTGNSGMRWSNFEKCELCCFQISFTLCVCFEKIYVLKTCTRKRSYYLVGPFP